MSAHPAAVWTKDRTAEHSRPDDATTGRSPLTRGATSGSPICPLTGPSASPAIDAGANVGLAKRRASLSMP
jgi:hypothetical protein